MSNSSETIFDAVGRGPVHPFPARMAATVALQAIARARTPLRVLDPMMGSGTVLAVARSKGHLASGVDIDPLAVLIARVWITAIDKESARKYAKRFLKKAEAIFSLTKAKDAYPHNADHETKAFLRYWFDVSARRQLSALAEQIHSCRRKPIRDVLWCAFSRLIIAKQAGASLALDLSHSRPHKFYNVAPKKPFENFLAAVEQVLANCLSKDESGRGPAARVKLGDARKLATKSSSIDMVLTSPPYLNAIDYMRCSKFSLVWMGYKASKIREVRGKSIGTEKGQYAALANDLATEMAKSLRINSKLSSRHKALFRRFIEDMDAVIREAVRVLVPGGKAVFVVGENELKGTYIRNSKIIYKLALRAGLVFGGSSTRKLPPNRRYLPPPKNEKGSINARMRKEVVITFVKRKNITLRSRSTRRLTS
jgi:DNA modification methylase